ncbi:hypothetical protein MXB_1146, partial [Myxobolus squamalis]
VSLVINGIHVSNILIDGRCQCQCENNLNPSYEKESNSCNKLGDLVCGKCKCYEGYHQASGEYCEHRNIFCPRTSNGICFYFFHNVLVIEKKFVTKIYASVLALIMGPTAHK